MLKILAYSFINLQVNLTAHLKLATLFGIFLNLWFAVNVGYYYRVIPRIWFVYFIKNVSIKYILCSEIQIYAAKVASNP